MSSRLWAAVEALADVWRTSPTVLEYADVFVDPQHRLGQQLREALAWERAIEAQRLLLAYLLQASPGYERFVKEPGAAQFLQQGARLAGAFLWTVEWWRSRLPGYPTIPAPQLVRGGPLSAEELTLRVPWRQDLRRHGLQLTPAPPAIANLLGVPPQPLDEASRVVGAAFATCSQVQALEQAQASLTDADRAALTAARDQARIALRPEQIDAAADDLALDRLAYREAVVAEALDNLRDGARRYGDAFTLADRLVEQAAALFSQAVVNGPAPKLGPVLRAERLRGGHGWTRVVIPEPFGLFVQLGDVVLFDTPGLTDAMHIEGVTEKFRGERWGVATLSGYLLPDSAGLRAGRWPTER